MGFVGVYRAVYDYTPTGEGELEIKEGDLLYIQEKSAQDDWWKAKKKAASDDEDEPEGLIPNNYVEEVPPTGKAKALYDYARQTDEEISFSEDTILEVFDTSDEDWTLVGLDGDYGFAPANYIESISSTDAAAAAAAPPSMPSRPRAESSAQPISPARSASPTEPSPAAAIAGLIQQKTGASQAPTQASRHQVQLTPEASDDEPPPMPTRPQSQAIAPPSVSIPSARSPSPAGVRGTPELRGPLSPGNYHLYNIHEMISHMGRNRKMPMTFGINVAKGTIMIAPEKSRDGPTQEWTAEKLTHYSIEGKHVFIELVRPSKSVDFHAGAKDTAQEIVQHLGELAGAARAEGLREVLAAGSGGGQKKGKMLYEFMAQGDDEVTVAVDDEVIILDDTQSEEWWMVKRLKNGREGVVPSSYVEITGSIPAAPVPGVDTAKSYVEQNRREEERLAREAAKSNGDKSSKHRNKSSGDSKTLPNQARVRTWTDRSANFKVDAEFLGLKDGKIHLHKQNGVKIAVPVAKMSVEDLEYVEKATGVSLDEDKPLSDIKRRSTLRANERTSSKASGRPGASVEPEAPRYEWFDFFLQCGVNPQVCERYANAFIRDNMGEENLQDIDATLLRTLGLKEGDNLRVMKHLDAKFGRERKALESQPTGDNQGLFSGAGGALRNNTRKGRPAPAVETNDTISAEAFRNGQSSPAPNSAPASSSKPGFDDNAWDVKPSANAGEPSRVASPAVQLPTPQVAAPTGAMSDLSILSAPLPQPLQPTPAPPKPQAAPQAPAQTAQPTGASSAFFDQLAKQDPSQSQISAPRTRPVASQQNGGLIAPPPPNRPTSAPQTQQQSQFPAPPLQPQRTGGYQPPPLPQLAPPGQSMNEMQQRQQMQQQYQQMQMQPTGYGGQLGQQNFGQMQPLQPQQTGFQQYGQQQFSTGQMNSSPFADPPRMPYQPTGFQPQQTGFQNQATGFQSQQGFQNFPQPMQPQPTGVNSFLPQPLQPQPTGFGSMNGQFGQPAPQMPPMPTQNQYNLQPLTTQKTGPPPPVRFGVQDAKKLVPQPTGRANLSKATPQNPFGF